MVAWLDRGHFAAHSFDDPGWFIAKDRRRAGRQRPMNAMKIAMAYAAGDGVDKHLARTWLVDLDLLDSKGLIGYTKNGGFDSHGCLLSQKLSLYTSCKTPRARFWRFNRIVCNKNPQSYCSKSQSARRHWIRRSVWKADGFYCLAPARAWGAGCNWE
jgi:hypothetical protein